MYGGQGESGGVMRRLPSPVFTSLGVVGVVHWFPTHQTSLKFSLLPVEVLTASVQVLTLRADQMRNETQSLTRCSSRMGRLNDVLQVRHAG